MIAQPLPSSLELSQGVHPLEKKMRLLLLAHAPTEWAVVLLPVYTSAPRLFPNRKSYIVPTSFPSSFRQPSSGHE